MDIPIWVYIVASGIIISALMAFKTGKEERKAELETIEKEGEVFMERLEQEKSNRKGQKATEA